jgi:PAS domain S-box-containing protein
MTDDVAIYTVAGQGGRRLQNDTRHIVDPLPGLVWTSLPDGQVDFLNRRWYEYTGLSADQARGWGWLLAICPDDLPRLRDYWQSILASGEPGECEARMRRSDGEDRWFLFRAAPLRDASGEIVKWYGTNTDIDERVRAEEVLRRSELRYRSIVETIPGLIIVMTADGAVDHANRNYLEYFGLSLEEWKGRAIGDTVHPDDLQAAITARTHSLETGYPYAVDYRLRGADEAYRWFQGRGLPQRDAAGQIMRWYVLLTDIDDLKRTEEARKRSDAFLTEAQRLSSTGCFSWRVATNELLWSEELYRIFEIAETVPLTFELVATRLHPEDVPVFNDLVARARRDGIDFEYELRLQNTDNSVKYLHVVSRAARDQNGQLEYVGAVQDVTERRLSEFALDKLRSELAHVSRVATLGALAASIAHEVNQPLSGIVTNSSTCLRMLAEDPPNIEGARETARRAIRDGNRAAEVIARLRALFKKSDFATEWLNLNEAVQEVVVLLGTEIQRERATVRAELADDLPLVRGDRVQLQQVTLNLLLNGVEAMSGVEGRPRQLVIKTECEGSDRVRVSVQDAGIGFDPAKLDQLFEAFHTTKSGGMGIGLSVSRSIIQSHDGWLSGRLNDGPGATFAFSIPRMHESVTAPNGVRAAEKSAWSARTAL